MASVNTLLIDWIENGVSASPVVKIWPSAVQTAMAK